MEISNLRRNAKLAGFSRLLGTPSSNFVLLAKETDGTSGRKVFIDQNLAAKFSALAGGEKGEAKVNSDRLLRQLYQLRAVAAGGTAFSNMQNAFEHMHIFGDLKVVYKVVQSSGSSEPSGVYVTDIDYASFRKGESPGFYKATFEARGKGWVVRRNDSTSILTKNAAINGLAKGLNHAGADILPSLVEASYGNRDGINAIRNEGYTLFYNPQSLRDKGCNWYTPEQKQVNRKHAAGMLGNGILEAQRRGQVVQWSIHGNGAKLFGEAIERLKGQNLDKHEVIFLSTPDESHLGKVLGSVRAAGMKLHEDALKVHEDDWSGALNRTIRAGAIANEVAKFGEEHVTQADVIRSQGKASLLASAGWIKFAAQLGATSLFKYNTLRNMVAVNAEITDAAVNPHFHPFKDKHQFAAHAKAATGGRVNSVFFSEIVKKIRGR
ncbi:conserved hypothetical protein [Teredinibacter turnerae T7901]|uniref:Uncharacterized protein n=1 Tax=Teredinibacter turnerae (strain ATCC 39867 / T7901) TaxID=377629 RepID=C5BQK1_TERTT|nr:hypothetical protein [Teredinibacter turnerae]ACR14490.1 conserved hypothetical protein [Teredinibacter turnerae T7901]